MRTNSGSPSSQREEFAQVQSFCTHAPGKSGCAASRLARSKMVGADIDTPRKPNDPGSEVSSVSTCGWK